MPRTEYHTRTFAYADRRSFVTIPFEVPAGTARIDVVYSVQSAQPEACATDIGLHDPQGWRGWSGSARRAIFVTPYHATPGYLLGPLTPGRWEVLLGLYELPESGCTIEVTITIQETVAEWLTGDLHTHTVHSDGRLTAPELCAFAVAQGLDYLAITDHNTVSQHQQEARNVPLLLIPGVEFTTYHGHANFFGWQPPLLDFRRDSDADLAEHFRMAHEAGMFISVNHPSEFDCGWERTFDLPYDAIEIWNWAWNDRDAASLARWQQQLVDGQKRIALGGSDFHGPGVPGQALPVVTRISVQERSVEALLAGLRAGHVIVASGVAVPHMQFTLAGAMIGDTVEVHGDIMPLSLQVEDGTGAHLRLISERGVEAEYRIETPAWARDQSVPADRRFYRVEVWSSADEAQPLLITNPIFLRQEMESQ
jgi:hypothetical protein